MPSTSVFFHVVTQLVSQVTKSKDAEMQQAQALVPSTILRRQQNMEPLTWRLRLARFMADADAAHF